MKAEYSLAGKEFSIKSSTETSPFIGRHIGPRNTDFVKMLTDLGCSSSDHLMEKTIPSGLRTHAPMSAVGLGIDEHIALAELQKIMNENKICRSFIGTGFYGTRMPFVIQRNILENPGWYTAYTPYQAEISQGRLEALINFQTMISELTGLPIANASLLDEATAAAEAMTLAQRSQKNSSNAFFVADTCHPQTIAVVETRARALGIEVVVGPIDSFASAAPAFGILVQYPETTGTVVDYRDLIATMQAKGTVVIMSADLLALVLISSPGDLGADIAVGTTQRFGVPMAFGGPHAAYLATKDEFARKIPGRIIGQSKDTHGNPAYRMSLQTREQHIRRDKATSNICTAQVLPAVLASMYAVYHGPSGLRDIAQKVHHLTTSLASSLKSSGVEILNHYFFDTLSIRVTDPGKLRHKALAAGLNFRYFDDGSIGISLDETTTVEDCSAIVGLFNGKFSLESPKHLSFPEELRRKSPILTQPVFNKYHSETELLRYMYRLQLKDLSLTSTMIPLGSCTMKLNSTSEMIPVTWPEVGQIHPFAPADQVRGFHKLCQDLETFLCSITGFSAVSLQPNAGSQGEYAGLLVIKRFHEVQGNAHRKVCLIPESAHGTNPASAALAGMQVVSVRCDQSGNIDLKDLETKANQHQANLAALMVTYPSTHGVFEAGIKDACRIIHEFGGQVYLDGANMNALVGYCRPAELGADVCHLNLHKTFCIPHGGGGPGSGPIGVAAHLKDYLPSDPQFRDAGQSVGAVTSTYIGNAGVLCIPWLYIRMMGEAGLKQATQAAILNANYIVHRLASAFPILYRGQNGMVAHECIVDLRPFKKSAGIEAEDVAKRLMDYGFHAPTMSWPVAGTLMIEPTESESLEELDRFCDAMLKIREEIDEIASGKYPREDNPLVNSPHTAREVTATEWNHSYPREKAAYPLPSLIENKFWPSVKRVDNAFGDRNLCCTWTPKN